MRPMSITWLHCADTDLSAARLNLGRDEALINEIGRHAGVTIPVVEGRLRDAGPLEGFILWNAYGRDLADAFAASSVEQSSALASKFAPRMVQIDASTSRIFQRLESLRIAAAIDVSSHQSWKDVKSVGRGRQGRQGIFGRRAIASGIDAHCDDRQRSKEYCYITGARDTELPQLVADYLKALHRTAPDA